MRICVSLALYKLYVINLICKSKTSTLKINFSYNFNKTSIKRKPISTNKDQREYVILIQHVTVTKQQLKTYNDKLQRYFYGFDF